jgi:uncharacterized protein (TIGR03435 family)
MKMPLIAGLVCAAVSVLYAQAPLAFDVASIRPVAPIVAGGGTARTAGIKIDGAQFRGIAMTVKEYLSIANKVRFYQIDGPDWIGSDRFDIAATLPEGHAKPAETVEMLKTLLYERFRIEAHKGTKDFPVYALVQTKDGIQAKESLLDPEIGRVDATGTGSSQGTFISLGRGSSLGIGGNRIEAKKFSMEALADTLARFMDRPVLDQTGLTSTYDVLIELEPQDFGALMVRSAVAAGVTLPPQAMKLLETASGDSLHVSLAKLGLKLEAKKAPLEMLIIDRADKNPGEN